jgi:hypothetical protein
MPYLIGYLNIIIDAFVAETQREYIDDETLVLLTVFAVEKLSHLKICLAVDALFEILKSLGSSMSK